jgi:hypothetical protein
MLSVLRDLNDVIQRVAEKKEVALLSQGDLWAQ